MSGHGDGRGAGPALNWEEQMVDVTAGLATAALDDGDAASSNALRWAWRLLLIGLLALAGLALQSAFASRAAHAADLEVDADCWDAHANDAGICGAGTPDMRI